MKKVMKKFKQTLSLVLAVAMVITMIPQNTLSVSAAELETIESATGETEEAVLNETETSTAAEESSTESVSTEDATAEDASETEAVAETAEAEEGTVPEETEQAETMPEDVSGEEVSLDGENETFEVKIEADEKAVTVSANTVTIPDEDYVFTAVANAGYENLTIEAYATADSSKNITVNTMEEIIDTYVIAKDAITENITIEITASVIMYTVTQIADDATITYTNNCVNEAGKIAAGTDLTFTVEATEGKKVGKVEYKIGEGEAVEIGADNDVYTIAKENITGDVTILVTVEGEQTYTLSFAANDFAEIADVTVNGENATVEDGNVTVKENDTVSFKVNAAELFEVTEVRANDIIVAAEDDIYTIEKVTENTTVNIATALDESKCNILTFAVDGDKGSYTATVSGNTVSGKDLSAEKTFCAGDTELVANGTIGVGLNIASGYEVEKVEVVVGKTATEIKETDGYYNVDFADSKNATIKVYTTPVGTEAVKRVVFTNGTKHLTYNVTTNENVKYFILI